MNPFSRRRFLWGILFGTAVDPILENADLFGGRLIRFLSGRHFVPAGAFDATHKLALAGLARHHNSAAFSGRVYNGFIGIELDARLCLPPLMALDAVFGHDRTHVVGVGWGLGGEAGVDNKQRDTAAGNEGFHQFSRT
jgi:hypothetical protein